MKRNLLLPYYNNGGILDLHFRTWAAYPQDVKDGLRIIVVDDASPRDPAEPHFRDVGIETQLYRIEEDVPWRWDGARNLGVREGVKSGEVVLMTDIDHLLTPENAERLVEAPVHPRRYYVPARRKLDGSDYKPHPNSFLLTRELFWEVGGYDERLSGYYGKDARFRKALNAISTRVEMKRLYLILYGREDIPDASTVDYGRKDSEYYTANHPEVRALLHDGIKPSSWCNFPWKRLI